MMGKDQAGEVQEVFIKISKCFKMSRKKEIFQKMRTINPDWDSDVQSRMNRMSIDKVEKELRMGGILRYSIIDDETGLWVEIRTS